MDDLPTRVGILETRVDKHDTLLGALRTDVSKIEAVLPSVATKADLAAISERLSAKIDTAVVGLLKDALSAYPARMGNIFALVSALAAIAAVAIAALKLHQAPW
jgi:hypothetical protein